METCRIYLSGGMGSLDFEQQSKWRKQIINAILFGDYNWEKKPIFFNPVDYYNFTDIRYKSEREVVEFDLNALRHSDLVIVNFNDPKSLVFWLDFIDDSTAIGKYSVHNIGRRTKVVNEKSIKTIKNPLIPDVLFIDANTKTPEELAHYDAYG